ncbi:MAG: hypothetical protein E7504_03270 [Ruminococcus sp.]|nr:hypothetical protein [Ruminococcus sp.]
MKCILLCLLIACSLLLQGCRKDAPAAQELYIQEVAHLYPLAELPESDANSVASTEPDMESAPLNYEQVHAVWIPVMQYGEWMTGKSAESFRSSVKTAFGNCKALGINTLYVHVRSYGDAYYTSDLFPTGSYLDGNYDPLAIMLEEAHALSLSVHAWINPMRASHADRLSTTDASYPLGKWYNDAEKNGTYLIALGSQYYLNPAYAEVRQLIADGVTEILERYDVDGIHIDDYFYPTQDAGFDAEAFAESGADDLAAWRRENCNAMVKAMYDAVKARDERLQFGISPQGNMRTNYSQLYADTALWCSTEGYCDYIAPQIYYGFENETCPFAETAALWAETATQAKLIVGLAPYKIGYEDEWAGHGKDEWTSDPLVLSKQADFLQYLDNVDGTALYSYTSLFSPDEAVAAMVTAESERITELWKSK